MPRIRVSANERYTGRDVTRDNISNPRSSVKPGPRLSTGIDGLSSAQLAMYVGMGSMTMLFGASLVAYFVTRANAQAWRAIDLPSLPWGIWLSTALLLCLSFVLRQGEQGIKQNKYRALTKNLFIALLLGLLFCASQFENWRQVARAAMSVEVKGLYIYTFFMLTVLHAVHVVFGLVPLFITHRRSMDHTYSSSHREGVHLLRQYWDFLLVIWLIVLVTLHWA